MSDNDDEIVYIASWKNSRSVYHEDKHCARFKTEDGGTPKERSKLSADRDPCSYCTDERTREISRTGSGFVCPYCDKEQTQLRAHLPCDETPTTQEVE